MKSRREVCFCMLRCSVTLAGSALLAQLFPARLLAQAPSAADLRAYMRAWFNTFPMETQKLADNVTMFDGPGGTGRTAQRAGAAAAEIRPAVDAGAWRGDA